LRYRLQKAVETEQFEEAAKIRDQLKELEKKQRLQESEEKDNNAAQ